MTRFFIPSSQIEGNRVFLRGADRHHLLTVLREGPGAEIMVLNGRGEEFQAKITAISPDAVEAEICRRSERVVEPRLRINLAQSLPKADKFEWIIQKNTEVGVARFQPVLSERSNIRLDRDTTAKKMERWRRIIQEAAEQSGRAVLPELEPIRSWDRFLEELRPGLILIPWEGEQTRSLREILSRKQPADGAAAWPGEVTVIIGPEGGFSLDEVAEAQSRGAIPVTLGPRILRTETAGLVVAAALLYHFDDLG
ncbi:MAG TPA: 16S rRNA (uracil(1498)-N(3))-methyltransferase [Bacillota bacterium]